ncbi:MAG: hypothetical protein HQK70_14495 [Desulfamplus sp.]|nr:hypothetical protein [Desulfamplus sp.]
MLELTQSQRARSAIREFKTITESLAIRGFYRPSGRFGKALENCLRELSPEIYGSMNDPRVVELKGLEYVVDRLPQGIEHSTKIILTDEDHFDNTPFTKIEPLKRRRKCYKINNNELCFIISRGISEIYDIITHMTFLNIEAKKIFKRMHDDYGVSPEWNKLEKFVSKIEQTNFTGRDFDRGNNVSDAAITPEELDSAIWNMSIIIGRPYNETRASYEYLENSKQEYKSNNGLFSLIYHLGKRIQADQHSRDDALVIYFTPSLMSIIGHQRYGKLWASRIDSEISDRNLQNRPLHIISANMHSVVNLIYGYATLKSSKNIKDIASKEYNNIDGVTSSRHHKTAPKEHRIDIDSMDIYDFCMLLRDKGSHIIEFASSRGLYTLPDQSGTNIDCQLIDTALLGDMEFHPALNIDISKTDEHPMILVMDYAFGAQAFEVMEQLLKPFEQNGAKKVLTNGSISIMGKAGILPGNKGDIMLATAHVCEGTSDNYLFDNDLTPEDFDTEVHVYVGPMATVLGTSLQNKDVLKMFMSDWKAVGLEMEGGYYHKAINASIIKGNIPLKTKVRYAYYASDNPLMTGNTLAAGAMGREGIKPTYMITKVILEKIMGKLDSSSSEKLYNAHALICTTEN